MSDSLNPPYYYHKWESYNVHSVNGSFTQTFRLYIEVQPTLFVVFIVFKLHKLVRFVFELEFLLWLSHSFNADLGFVIPNCFDILHDCFTLWALTFVYMFVDSALAEANHDPNLFVVSRTFWVVTDCLKIKTLANCSPLWCFVCDLFFF